MGESVYRLIPLIIVLILAEMVFKAIALWKSATQKQYIRFICLFIFNTGGILPLIYLIGFQKEDKKE
ncbi:MAG: DUF5652 family protein [Candidatus Peribacteria bacterium]|nr:DUF5652 family protein [Candidatus Peribacteria bacterium]